MFDDKFVEIVSLANALALAALMAIIAVLLAVYRRLASFAADRLARWRFQILGSVPIVRLIAWVGGTAIGVFGILDPPRDSLIAIAASAGLALGLALQDVIKNLLAGVVMIFQRPFTVGDMVSVGGHYGEVIAMDLNAIRLRTFEDSVVTVPNSLVLNQAVLNSNSGSVNELVATAFTVLGEVDVLHVRRVAAEAAACSPYVFLGSPIIVFVEDRSDRQRMTRFVVKAYVVDVRLERVMSADVFTRITRSLDLPDPCFTYD